jgi:hypothetical protein
LTPFKVQHIELFKSLTMHHKRWWWNPHYQSSSCQSNIGRFSPYTIKGDGGILTIEVVIAEVTLIRTINTWDSITINITFVKE